jgi:hypothetical protein
MFARIFGGGAGGDYVYSQAELDRIVSQLMEQHQGNAPPPAAEEDIKALPRIKVTEAMVLEGLDCTVCKEDLVLDEELVQLPCKHNYHFACVAEWLKAHDVCFPCLEDRKEADNQPDMPYLSPPHNPRRAPRSTLLLPTILLIPTHPIILNAVHAVGAVGAVAVSVHPPLPPNRSTGHNLLPPLR